MATKAKSKKTRTISLTPAEINAVNANGGPTFRPLARDRMLCNQLPQFGPLNRTRVKFVRRMCGSLPPKQTPVVQSARPVWQPPWWQKI